LAKLWLRALSKWKQQATTGFHGGQAVRYSWLFQGDGMPVLRGRDFTQSDSATTPGVVIVSQTVARTLWPGQDPIGKRISMEDEPKPKIGSRWLG